MSTYCKYPSISLHNCYMYLLPPSVRAMNEGNFRCEFNEWTGRTDAFVWLVVGGCDVVSLTDDFADASNLVGGSIEGGDFLHCGASDRVLQEENQDVNGCYRQHE